VTRKTAEKPGNGHDPLDRGGGEIKKEGPLHVAKPGMELKENKAQHRGDRGITSIYDTKRSLLGQIRGGGQERPTKETGP